ncbi:zinc finger protein 260-like isoform X2 [Armigeres subalbatus]
METAVQQPVISMKTQESTASRWTLNDFCRTCLLRKEPLLPLTSDFNGTMIPEMLWKVSGTLLNVLEQLPRTICDHCLAKLDLAYNIAQEFRKQEELLRSFCWKGALIEQLDGFQKTEDAFKVPYSDEVLEKLTHAKQQFRRTETNTPVEVSEECLTPTVEEVGEISEFVEEGTSLEKENPPVIKEKSTSVRDVVPSADEIIPPAEQVGDYCVEQLDDIIEMENDVIEEDIQADDHFEMIVDESSTATESSVQEKTTNVVVPEEHSINDDVHVKKEESDNETVQSEVFSMLIPKEENEEWIETEERLSEGIGDGSDSEQLAIISCGESGDSQDRNWYGQPPSGLEVVMIDQEEYIRPIQGESKSRNQSMMEKEPTNPSEQNLKKGTNADGLYECKLCDRTFSVQKTYLNHRRSHEHVFHESFKCQQCEKVFGTKNRLKRHEEIHTRDLSCKVCGKEFSNGHELRAHQPLHLKGKRKCSSCDFVSYTREQMKEHVRTSKCAKSHKPPPKPPKLKNTNCPYEGCSYKATTYGAMYVHKRAKHLAVFECEICDKKFAFANQLKQHESIHTGEKPFECDLCAKTFRRLFSFKEHMAIHEGQAIYECAICGKVFSRPRYLAAHVATHSTKRPFDCTMCGTNYKTKGELTKHIRAKHESLEYGNSTDLIEEDYDYFEDEIYV